MSAGYLIILIFLIILILELMLFLIVNFLRRKYSWIVTKNDEQPEFDPIALRKFIDYSFDPNLGWVRRPNTEGTDKGQKGIVSFHIDSNGARSSKTKKNTPVIAAFGDSYTFCRQVEDNETWEEQLALLERFGVLNYGVGNYGLDQALLRYEAMKLPDTVKIVAMGVVPETICRVQSTWKHYLEFGNTFAFKPRFIINSAGALQLIENPVNDIEDIFRLNEKIDVIRESDRFYISKFRSLQFRFPYLFTLLRNPRRHIGQIVSMIISSVYAATGKSTPWSEDLPFSVVMKNNLRDAHSLYKDEKSVDLMNAILTRFMESAGVNGHIPLLIIIPQLMDLRLSTNIKPVFQDYYQQAKSILPVLDLTESFLGMDFEDLYINDQYGGHLSPAGNILVAEEISAWIKERNMEK